MTPLDPRDLRRADRRQNPVVAALTGALLVACGAAPTAGSDARLGDASIAPDEIAPDPIAREITADGQVRVFRDERPSPTPLPGLPSIQIAPDAGPPRGLELERDGAVADRLISEGSSVEYPFDAAEGELSLFEFTAIGFSRGWESAATLEVRNEDGQLLCRASRDSGAVYGMFLPFVAPSTGRYALRIHATREYFRYQLARQSGYVARGPTDVLLVGDRATVHGYLRDVDDRVVYALPLTAGETVRLSVLAGTEGDQRKQRTIREQALTERLGLAGSRDGTMGGHGMGGSAEARAERARRAAARSGSGRLADLLTQPSLALEYVGVEPGPGPTAGDGADDGAPVTRGGGHFLQITPRRDGEVLFDVRATDGRDGGRFELRVERGGPVVRVTGFVDDPQGDPAPGVALRFLREPELDDVGAATTDAGGAYAVEVPPGDYTVIVTGEPGSTPLRVRAGLEVARELNVVYP